MIARIAIWIILLIVLSDYYLYRVYISRNPMFERWHRLVWFMPGTAMIIYTVALAMCPDFIPRDLFWVRSYLVFVGLLVVPKAVFSFFSGVGLFWARRRHLHRNYGNAVGALMTLAAMVVFFYGLFYGWRRLEIKHLDLYVADLPASFEGYRILQFSDAHVGSFYNSSEDVLQRDIDSINAQKADMIVFTGDLQNTKPLDIVPFYTMLGSLHAKDGVYSILGNHDYAHYVKTDIFSAERNCRQTQKLERNMGWDLLMNENRVIVHGNDSIYLVGEENNSDNKEQDHVDRAKAYRGIPQEAFVIALQHNPRYWDESLVGDHARAIARLTLSGHTHAGQVNIFGLRPTEATYDYDYGLYEQQDRFLNVSGGLGGLVQFRVGATPEFTVITLHRLTTSK